MEKVDDKAGVAVLDNSRTIGVPAGTVEVEVTEQVDPAVVIVEPSPAPVAVMEQAAPIVLPFDHPVVLVAPAATVRL